MQYFKPVPNPLVGSLYSNLVAERINQAELKRRHLRGLDYDCSLETRGNIIRLSVSPAALVAEDAMTTAKDITRILPALECEYREQFGVKNPLKLLKDLQELDEQPWQPVEQFAVSQPFVFDDKLLSGMG